jgi:hypothetical protein
MIPPLPPARGLDQDGGTAEIAPRYEDITQDGRLQLASLMPGLGAAIWKGLLSKIPAIETFQSQGILPILRRLVLVGEDRPVSVNVPIRYAGSFRFAREKDGDRLFANMWLEARAPIASTLGPNPPSSAPYELVGRVFAEHVITRPFAPPAERKVTRLDAPGVPAIPEDEHTFEPAEALLDTGDGALEYAGDVHFGMMHTDSNQHVNSLVYPRAFEELVSRRLVQEAPVPDAHLLLARAIEIRWRRPFFAGEHARVAMRLVDAVPGSAWKISAVGSFQGDGAKPSTTLKMCLR